MKAPQPDENARRRDRQLEAELAEMLAPHFSGMTVEVGHSDQWDRMCVTFRWPGFVTLLPEERFHRLARVIPSDFRDSRLDGFVWLELTPDETVEAFLRLPRSEEVAEREADIYADLLEAGFFESLGESMGPTPDRQCRGGFSEIEAVLSGKNCSAANIRDAKLVFIRHGAYCDCQVLQTVLPELAKSYAGAA